MVVRFSAAGTGRRETQESIVVTSAMKPASSRLFFACKSTECHQLLYGIAIDRDHFGLEDVKRRIEYEFADVIKQFIKVDINERENYAEGHLYLPLIADAKMRNLEKSVDTWMSSAMREERAKVKLEAENVILKELVDYLGLPFYKRWFADKPH